MRQEFSYLYLYAALPTTVLIKDLSCLFIELPFICTMFFALQHFLRLLSRESRQAILYFSHFFVRSCVLRYWLTVWLEMHFTTHAALQYRLVEKSVRRRFVPYHN